MKSWTQRGACGGMLIMAIIIAMATLPVYLHPEKQRDFGVMYAAATAFKQGLNPYDPAVVGTLTREGIVPYVYPPYTLYFFRPFTWFDFSAAARIFLTLKLVAIAGLLYLWHGI